MPNPLPMLASHEGAPPVKMVKAVSFRVQIIHVHPPFAPQNSHFCLPEAGSGPGPPVSYFLSILPTVVFFYFYVVPQLLAFPLPRFPSTREPPFMVPPSIFCPVQCSPYPTVFPQRNVPCHSGCPLQVFPPVLLAIVCFSAAGPASFLG